MSIEEKNSDGGFDYKADCERCAGLCCIVFAHHTRNGFPEYKAGNKPCKNLTSAGRCTVFADLEAEGYLTCRPYDCYGAGQIVTQTLLTDPDKTDRRQLGEHTEVVDAFKELSRLHLLIVAFNDEEGPAARHVQNRLEAVSKRFADTGTFEIDQDTRRLLRREEVMVGRALARIGSGTALRSR